MPHNALFSKSHLIKGASVVVFYTTLEHLDVRRVLWLVLNIDDDWWLHVYSKLCLGEYLVDVLFKIYLERIRYSLAFFNCLKFLKR